MRTAIDEDTASTGVLPPYGWSWPNVGPGAPIQARYYAELRDAIQRLWFAKGRGFLPPWSQEVPEPGFPIRASHLTDLRRWLNQYEDNHPPAAQGVDSKSYDPAAGNLPLIGPEWADEIRSFVRVGEYSVRCNIRSPGSPAGRNLLTATDLQRYAEAFNLYRQRGVRVFALLTREFYDPAGSDPRSEFDAAFTNPYITGFADEARRISDYFSQPQNGGVQDYIIWNEPNVNPPIGEGYLQADHFAALLFRCWHNMPNASQIYWGGIFTNHAAVDEGALQYIDAVYQWLLDRGLVSPPGWPWTEINIHVHEPRPGVQVPELFRRVREIQTRHGDPSEIMVGEWGVRYADGPIALTNLSFSLRDQPSRMFFFTHPTHRDPFDPNPNPWGLRHWTEAPGDPGEPGAYVLLGQTDPVFYTTYDNLVGA